MENQKPRFNQPTTEDIAIGFDEATLAALDRLAKDAGLDRDAVIRGAIWYAYDSEYSQN